jgi:hypothetical protein
MLLAVGVVIFVAPAWLGFQLPAPSGALPHTFWAEGVIERMGPGPAGQAEVVVAVAGGKNVTAALDAMQTSVFQPGQALHVGHLKPGQRVRMSWVQDQARSIEILGHPMPGSFHYFD